MSILLPVNFDQLIENSVKKFWQSRIESTVSSQEGNRGSVIGGKNLDGFADVVREIAIHCGMQADCVITTGKKNLTIPGYFRPTKMWDSVVVYKGRLIAAFELKSQVGPSFRNNFNNRSEESIGSAKDFWTAHREKAFELTNYSKAHEYVQHEKDIKPPFLGYLMLLEDCDASTTSVKTDESHFKIFPEFFNASYERRYQVLCEKMVAEGLYSSSCLMLSDRSFGGAIGKFRCPSPELSPKSLFADFAGRLLAAIELYEKL